MEWVGTGEGVQPKNGSADGCASAGSDPDSVPDQCSVAAATVDSERAEGFLTGEIERKWDRNRSTKGLCGDQVAVAEYIGHWVGLRVHADDSATRDVGGDGGAGVGEVDEDWVPTGARLNTVPDGSHKPMAVVGSWA